MLITNLGINPVSETMAKACNKYETDEGECWAEQLNIGCPFSSDDFEAVSCDEIKPEHWREVLADAPNPKEKPEPRFRFGDKVTHHIDFPVKAVFSAYKDSRHSGEAYVLFDGSPECEVVFVRNLKAGWE
jgi:hypothetical protein